MTMTAEEYGTSKHVSQQRIAKSLATLEELEWMIECGLNGWEIEKALGQSMASLARMAVRYGRHELARPFNSILAQEDGHRKRAARAAKGSS